MRAIDYNGYVPDSDEQSAPDRIAEAAELSAAALQAMEQIARDALDRLNAILAKLQ